MKERYKLLFMLVGIVVFAVITQIKIGNQYSWIIGGVLLFGMGFGWYAKSSQQERRIK